MQLSHQHVQAGFQNAQRKDQDVTIRHRIAFGRRVGAECRTVFARRDARAGNLDAVEIPHATVIDVVRRGNLHESRIAGTPIEGRAEIFGNGPTSTRVGDRRGKCVWRILSRGRLNSEQSRALRPSAVVVGWAAQRWDHRRGGADGDAIGKAPRRAHHGQDLDVRDGGCLDGGLSGSRQECGCC